MKTRIFLRTMRFVAYNWWLPFLLGNAVALLAISFTAHSFNDAFVSSLETVVQSCAR
ncbi:hypothetical protein [Pseudomonas aeruginosa]|nr:hypothetical protein [Pseudomonas aeruginosa]MDH0237189.1 hypothetical protein [Pseudomonas aeruginosa]MDH0473092.1 hypothetical protein [Pseudomonas aeruginosa]HBN8933138.1 hypothetical protein [Pseudomonas aeruginosa]HBN8952981.1 hypothetical protein [Pseudomonas aeruginosa]HBP5461222.1 hypothetical protein [Pseudomonas aeruginosa]